MFKLIHITSDRGSPRVSLIWGESWTLTQFWKHLYDSISKIFRLKSFFPFYPLRVK